MSVRRLLWFRGLRLVRTPMCPPVVRVAWADLTPDRAWPCRLELPDVPRNVAGRKVISGLLGTSAWVWTGPTSICAWAKKARK